MLLTCSISAGEPNNLPALFTCHLIDETNGPLAVQRQRVCGNTLPWLISFSLGVERAMWNGNSGAFKAYATFRISGDGLEPSAVSNALGLSPSKVDVSVTGFGTWNYSTRDLLDNLRPLEEHVLHILQLLEPRSLAVVALAEKFAIEVFCYFASQSDLGGFHLSSDTLARLGRLQLDFDVDEYFCCVKP